MRIELNNREWPFLRLLQHPRLVTIIVITPCPVYLRSICISLMCSYYVQIFCASRTTCAKDMARLQGVCFLLCKSVTACARGRPHTFQSILLRLCYRTHLLSLIRHSNFGTIAKGLKTALLPIHTLAHSNFATIVSKFERYFGCPALVGVFQDAITLSNAYNSTLLI